MSNPVFSIITPSYNRADVIENAIKSVLEQEYFSFEHIIVDGNSTDETQKVLQKFPHLVTMIESDVGLYDALNKGIQKAQGEIIGLLNTDDFYERGVFQEVVRIFKENEDVDAVIGQAASVKYLQSGTRIVEKYPALRQNVLLSQLVSGPPAINAWFFKRRLFDRTGSFDLEFPIGADRDFLIRLCFAGFHPYFVDRVFYYYQRHTRSLTVSDHPDAKERFMKENLRLARKYMDVTVRNSDFWYQCRMWHDLTSIELSILLARQLRLHELADTIRLAMYHNRKWLLLVISQGPERLKNFILKKMRIAVGT